MFIVIKKIQEALQSEQKILNDCLDLLLEEVASNFGGKGVGKMMFFYVRCVCRDGGGGGGLFYMVQYHTLGLSMGCFYLTRFSCL